MRDESLLIINGVVVTLGECGRLIKDGAVLIRAGIIDAVGRRETVEKNADGVKILDARGGIIMPGFINTHTHLYSTFARGLSPKPPPPGNLLETLKHLWWPLDETLNHEDIYHSARSALVDCIQQGVTALIDHHESQFCPSGSLDILERALRETGVRGCLCYGVSDRCGTGDEGVAENARFLRKCSERDDDFVMGAAGLHALFTMQPRTLDAVVEVATSFDAGLHLHLAEGRIDQVVSRKRYGVSVTHRLRNVGGLYGKTLAAHGVHIQRAEMKMLATSGVCVTHNPRSNMGNGVGALRVGDMLERGIVVGLGSDALSADMRTEALSAYLLHSHNRRSPSGFMDTAVQLLLRNNAIIASRFFKRPLGVIKKGAHGDVAVLGYNPPTEMNLGNFAGHFLFGISDAPVLATVVAGRVLMEGGIVRSVDAVDVKNAARKQFSGFRRRFERHL